jgi:hypothetical protein
VNSVPSTPFFTVHPILYRPPHSVPSAPFCTVHPILYRPLHSVPSAPFCTTQSPHSSKSNWKFSMSLSFLIFPYITQSSAKSPTVNSKSFQILLTYTKNRNWPNTLPCGTTDVTMTSTEDCPPSLTLYERPNRNSRNHISTVGSTANAAVFVSSQS